MRSDHSSTPCSWDERFQQAALDPGQWMPALQELADATGSSRAELVGFGGDLASFNWVTSIDERVLADYFRAEGTSPSLNYRIIADGGRPPLEIVDEGHYDSARRAVARDDYVDFCEDNQMVFGCQTALVRDDSGLVGLSVLRSRGEGRTTERERQVFADAARAALTAVRMQRAIEEQGFHLLAGTLEAMSLPCLLLDGLGRARHVTPAAERAIARHSLLVLAGQILSSTDCAIRRSIDLALRTILGREPRAHARVPLYGEGPVPNLVLDFFRLPQREWATRFAPCAILVLRDRSAGHFAGANVLADTFGLTVAETEVALALAAGSSRETIAATRNVSPETLRAQLKSLYLKTGCRRETELALLVTTLLD
jgi:DNA-binding CsgD family transcriptional regulator